MLINHNNTNMLELIKLKRRLSASNRSRVRINHDIEVGARSSENYLTSEQGNRITI